MISSKELLFVKDAARKVPYPGDDYSHEAMAKLKESLEMYKKTFLNTSYNITFSNNDVIDLEIFQQNISHMLGIDKKNIFSEFMFDFRNSVLGLPKDELITTYDLLQLIIDNSDKIIEYDKNNSSKAINYYKVSVKCDIFSKLTDLIRFNFGCINFDLKKHRSIANYPYSGNSERFLYFPSDEALCPYFLVGILKNNINQNNMEEDSIIPKYAVETSMAPFDLHSFFKEQEVIIPTHIVKDDGSELAKYVATPTQKKILLNDYKSILLLYGFENRMNIYSDYIATLSEKEKRLTLK